MTTININGTEYKVPEGCTILEALNYADVKIPALCHDERLKPFGGCRLCVVEVDEDNDPVTACTTALLKGMRIKTHTPLIEKMRKNTLKMLADRYPASAYFNEPHQEFHRYIKEYGLERELAGNDCGDSIDLSHPYIRVDMSRCVRCFRCVRICEEVQGEFVWYVYDRGDRIRFLPGGDFPLSKSKCVSCGACVDTCPSGALEDLSIISEGYPDQWTKTICPYCGTGCKMHVGVTNNKIVAVSPVIGSPVNKGHLCVKGRYAFTFNNASDRITSPMIKNGGRWKRVTWDEALESVAMGFERIKRSTGKDSLGVLGSARATNEENYLAQKFARVVLETNNVDCCARVCHAPSAAALKIMFGTGAATNSFEDIDYANTVLVAGSNATENHPVLGARIKKAKRNGTRLIVVDPRRVELAQLADVHLYLNPGTNVALFNSIASVIIEERLTDDKFVRDRTEGWKEFCNFIYTYTPEKVADICGVPARLIRNAARMYATAKPSMSVHGLGMTEHEQGTESVMSLINIALLTGNVGKRGTGINPLRGQNNVQGSAHMGCEPDHLTGFAPIKTEKNVFEKVWGKSIPEEKGKNLIEMMRDGEEGKLKAIWAIGYDFYLTNSDAGNMTQRALENMEMVVIQDMFMTETGREFGTAFLPVASPFEKEGTFMNGERRIQKIRKVLEPPEGVKTDWRIICEVAHKMGMQNYFNYHTPEEIWNEIREVWGAGSGISYERIETVGLQWPCRSEEDNGTVILHGERFSSGKRTMLRKIKYKMPVESSSENFPFTLMTGRNLYHFNSGSMTLRSSNIILQPEDYLFISEEDAARLDIKSGEKVRVISRYGEIVKRVRISHSVRKGDLFTTFHLPGLFTNKVTNSYYDRYTATPAYKLTAVAIEKASGNKVM